MCVKFMDWNQIDRGVCRLSAVPAALAPSSMQEAAQLADETRLYWYLTFPLLNSSFPRFPLSTFNCGHSQGI